MREKDIQKVKEIGAVREIIAYCTDRILSCERSTDWHIQKFSADPDSRATLDSIIECHVFREGAYSDVKWHCEELLKVLEMNLKGEDE
jgi:hypothetical protein